MSSDREKLRLFGRIVRRRRLLACGGGAERASDRSVRETCPVISGSFELTTVNKATTPQAKVAPTGARCIQWNTTSFYIFYRRVSVPTAAVLNDSQSRLSDCLSINPLTTVLGPSFHSTGSYVDSDVVKFVHRPSAGALLFISEHFSGRGGAVGPLHVCVCVCVCVRLN